MNTSSNTALRLLAAFVVALGLLLSGCSAIRPVAKTTPSAPTYVPPPTPKVFVVNGMKDVNLTVTSNTGKEVELEPFGKADFPLGSTLIFIVVKNDEDVGVYSRAFPLPRTSRAPKDFVFVFKEPKDIQQGVLSGIP